MDVNAVKWIGATWVFGDLPLFLLVGHRPPVLEGRPRVVGDRSDSHGHGRVHPRGHGEPRPSVHIADSLRATMSTGNDGTTHQ